MVEIEFTLKGSTVTKKATIKGYIWGKKIKKTLITQSDEGNGWENGLLLQILY